MAHSASATADAPQSAANTRSLRRGFNARALSERDDDLLGRFASQQRCCGSRSSLRFGARRSLLVAPNVRVQRLPKAVRWNEGLGDAFRGVTSIVNVNHLSNARHRSSRIEECLDSGREDRGLFRPTRVALRSIAREWCGQRHHLA